jgi:hypothetical protein
MPSQHVHARAIPRAIRKALPIAIAAAFILSACGGGGGDDSAPTLSLAQPVSGVSVSASRVLFSGTASDNESLSEVRIWLQITPPKIV